MFGKVDPQNILIRLQMSDTEMVKTLSKTPDPKLAEMLIERKLKSIGLTEQEQAVVLMCNGLGYPVDKAMSETGLAREQLDSLYDSGVNKINNHLNGGGDTVLTSLGSIFPK